MEYIKCKRNGVATSGAMPCSHAPRSDRVQGSGAPTGKGQCLRPGLNRGPSVYKTDALPLSHRGAMNFIRSTNSATKRQQHTNNTLQHTSHLYLTATLTASLVSAPAVLLSRIFLFAFAPPFSQTTTRITRMLAKCDMLANYGRIV